MRLATRTLYARATGQQPPATDPPAGAGVAEHGGVAVGDGIVVLRRVHRFGGGIAALAEAVQRGDADAAVGLLRAGRFDIRQSDVRWIEVDVADDHAAAALAPVRQAVVEAGRRV